MIVRIYKWQLVLLFGVAGIFGFVIGRTLRDQAVISVKNPIHKFQGKKNPVTVLFDRDLFTQEKGGGHKINEIGYLIYTNGEEGVKIFENDIQPK